MGTLYAIFPNLAFRFIYCPFFKFLSFIYLFNPQPICCYSEDSDEQSAGVCPPQWVVLAVVQSYNSRRKVPRSKISLSDLECCLSKASFTAAQNSGKVSTHLA
jgi:hypothetical protein